MTTTTKQHEHAAGETTERFALVLQAVPDPDGAPSIIRLRRFLKMALRSFGLRCVKIEPAKNMDLLTGVPKRR